MPTRNDVVVGQLRRWPEFDSLFLVYRITDEISATGVYWKAVHMVEHLGKQTHKTVLSSAWVEGNTEVISD